MTKFIITNRFRKDIKKLSADGKKKVSKAFDLLENDSDHPSLHVEKLTGTDNIWSLRLSIQLRMTFSKRNSETIILRRIGTHQIYQKP